MMPPHRHALGGTMRLRTTASAAAVFALSLAGCSNASTDKPDPTSSSSATGAPTPGPDRAAAEQECIDGWVKVLEATGDPDVDDQPAVCAQVSGKSAEMYAEALRQVNDANRKPLDDCLSDASCTALPVPR